MARPFLGARSLAALLASGLGLSLATGSPRGRLERIDHEDGGDLPALGPRYAPVTIEFFADLGDSYSSGQLHHLLRELVQRHPRGLRVVYRLCGRGEQASHPNQHLLAALEAHAAGRFFEFVDAMYAGTLHSPRVDAFAAIATRAGVDPARIAAAIDLDGPLARAREGTVRANHLYRRRHRLHRVPGLLVNGRPFDRRPTSVEELEELYDEALGEARRRLDAGVPLERLLATLLAERPGPTAERGPGPLLLDGLDPGEELPTQHAPLVHLDPARGETIGPDAGPLTVTLFCNLVTRNCATAAAALRELRDAYPGELRTVFRLLHDDGDREQRGAADMASAGWCAARQGRFEALFDLLLVRSGRPAGLDVGELDDAAAATGIDRARFHECRTSPATARALAAEIAAARREGVRRTPSLVIDGRLHLGARSFDELVPLVDQALAPGVLGSASF